MRALAFLLALTAGPTFAETPLSAEAFEALTTGQTLTYSARGQVFGVEEYLRNRQVRWSFVEGECEDGYWYPAGDMICFAYDSYEIDQCWTFFLQGDQITARYENDPNALELVEIHRTDAPLLCPGPKVGV